MSAADGLRNSQTANPTSTRAEACQPFTGELRRVADLIPHPDLVKPPRATRRRS